MKDNRIKDTKSNVPLQFGVQIKNARAVPVNIALFAGAVNTRALTTDEDAATVLTNGDATNLNLMGLGVFAAVMSDGFLPVDNGVVNTKADYVSVNSTSPNFSVDHMREHLKSNYYTVKRLIYKVTSQDQFENQIQLATVCPFKNFGISTIAPTNYANPTNFQNNKIIIDDTPFVLGDDTFMGMVINAGETVTLTFELE